METAESKGSTESKFNVVGRSDLHESSDSRARVVESNRKQVRECSCRSETKVGKRMWAERTAKSISISCGETERDKSATSRRPDKAVHRCKQGASER